MTVKVYIPTSFRKYSGNRARIETEASTIAGLLDELKRLYPVLYQQILNGRGEIYRHINIYVNNQAIEDLQGTATPLRDGDEVAIIPAIAGGLIETGRGGEAW